MCDGVSRQGGPGIGGGLAAGRHRATPIAAAAAHAAIDCISCGRPVTTTFVVESGRLYCGPVCAASPEAMVPGRYLG
jgi:hypothetical protein